MSSKTKLKCTRLPAIVPSCRDGLDTDRMDSERGGISLVTGRMRRRKVPQFHARGSLNSYLRERRKNECRRQKKQKKDRIVAEGVLSWYGFSSDLFFCSIILEEGRQVSLLLPPNSLEDLLRPVACLQLPRSAQQYINPTNIAQVPPESPWFALTSDRRNETFSYSIKHEKILSSNTATRRAILVLLSIYEMLRS